MIESQFLKSLVEKARPHYKTIVLPEGEDARVLRAANIINREKAAKIVILGDYETISTYFSDNKWSLEGITIIKPETSDKLEQYANLLYELRKDKGVTLEQARKIALQYNYFGTLMVKAGDADGMVSGANHSTADTVRPALQIIKSAKKGQVVSSFVMMISQGKQYFFSDCALNIRPTSAELADIAISTAESVIAMGYEPKIAMLSYSTFGSGVSEEVDKVRIGAELAKQILQKPEYANLNIVLDGEMQVDAAVDTVVATKKAPQSKVAGRANTLIFPDLNAGNIGYKLVQRLGGCEAYGPILQGLNAPINDLSRGAFAEDIVGVIAITALQAVK